MTHETNTETQATRALDIAPAEFAALGEGHLAYVKPMSSDEVRRLFPQAPELAPGLDLFALLSASGAPILLTESRDAAFANSETEPVDEGIDARGGQLGIASEICTPVEEGRRLALRAEAVD